jgi:hypothetical protein
MLMFSVDAAARVAASGIDLFLYVAALPGSVTGELVVGEVGWG